MADAGSLEVSISATTDALSAALSDALNLLSGSLPSFETAALAIGGAVVAGLTTSLVAYGELENAATGLAVALRNSGDASRSTLQDMLDYAGSLKDASRFSKDEIITVETMLATMGLQGEQLKQATQATINLGTQTGNLTQAARLLGNAYEGNGMGLRRFGINVAATLSPSLMFAEVMGKINEKFGGRAAADVETMSGSLASLYNTFKDLAATIGASLAPSIKSLIEYIKDNKDELKKIALDIANAIIDVINALIKMVNYIESNMPTIAHMIDALGTMVGKIKESISGLAALWNEPAYRYNANYNPNPVGSQPGGAAGASSAGSAGGLPMLPHITSAGAGNQGLAGTAQGNMGNSRQQAEESISDSRVFAAAWNDAFNQVFLGTKKLPIGLTEAQQKVMFDSMKWTKQLTQLFSGMTSSLASGIDGFLQGILLKSENIGQALMHIGTSMLNFMLSSIAKVSAEFIMQHLLMLAKYIFVQHSMVAAHAVATVENKALDVSEATSKITTDAAVGEAGILSWFAHLGPVGIGIGLAMAAAVGAMIMKFAKFATGGIVKGPMMGMVGEAGPEAIIPLNSPQGRQILGSGGGDGGSVGGAGDLHLHISGTFIEGNAAHWERLTRNVIIPAMERHGRKTRRTRGTVW